jgi:hypothetical protein
MDVDLDGQQAGPSGLSQRREAESSAREGGRGKTKSTCQKCNREFDKRESLALHKKQCPDRCPVSCELCGWRFTTRSKLTIHKKQIHPAEFLLERPVTGPKKWGNYKKCPHCGRMIATPNWQVHVDECHSYTYICTICHHRFMFQGYLDAHMVRAHSDMVAPDGGDVPDGPD